MLNRRPDEMDINSALRSETHRKIVSFFHENQASIDTPKGVATWIGADRSKVKDALEDLVRLKILVAHRSTSTTGYSYTRDEKIMAKVAKFLKEGA